jgi:hypothetical protein
MNNHPVLRGICTVLLPLLGSLGAASASAAAWEYNPRVLLSGVYNDNYRLDPVRANQVSVSGTQADAGVQMQAHWPTTNLVIWPYVSASYYPNHTELNEDLEFLDLNLGHTGLKSKSSIDANYSQRTLLTEVLPTTDVGTDLGVQSVGTSLAALEERNRQRLLLLRPTAEITLTPRSRFQFRADYVDATYSRQTGNYVNYKNLYGSAGWGYEVSPRGSLIFSGTASRFTPGSGGSSANTYGLQVDWYKLVTQTARYYFRVGGNRTQFGNSGAPGASSTSANSASGGAGVSWAFQVTNIFLDATRSVSPSTSGTALEQSELRFRLERRWTPRTATFAGLVGVKQDGLGSASSTVDNSYVSGTVGVEWRITRALALSSAYSYARQSLGFQPNSANANVVRISFVYEPNRPAQGSAVSVPY